MLDREIDQKVRSWLHSEPSHFDGADSGECLRRSHGHAGAQCSIDEWREALARYGFVPREIRAALLDDFNGMA